VGSSGSGELREGGKKNKGGGGTMIAKKLKHKMERRLDRNYRIKQAERGKGKGEPGSRIAEE